MASLLSPPSTGGSPAGDPLEQVNQRWAGAACRLRFAVPIRESRDSDGWSKSGWIVPAAGRKVREGNTGAILRDSDRDLLDRESVGPLTRLVAEGWEAERGLRLRLRCAGVETSGRSLLEVTPP